MDQFLPALAQADERIPYVWRLDLKGIHTAMIEAETPLLIEGVCVREVLARLGVAADRHVYMRALSDACSWDDETLCDVARIREELEFDLDRHLSALDRELLYYHLRHDPYGNAGIVFDRVGQF